MTPNMMNLQKVQGQTFVGATVQIDGGVAYINCRFVNCTIVFTGTGLMQLQNTSIENPRWSFTGPAGNTINFLRTLYTTGQKELVEQIFQTIRTGVVPPVQDHSVPPTPSGAVQ